MIFVMHKVPRAKSIKDRVTILALCMIDICIKFRE